MSKLRIQVPAERIGAICRKWKIIELSLFGSVLRDDFGPESDVDVLVAFEDDADWNVFDILALTEELKDAFDRNVDLVEKDAIRNPFRRHNILNHHEVVYAAG
ncbi:MAG TPA: DNA polymerase subunit beta [Planctomycetes bacterium]|nr:DNA polymerase subunit beta [Planctomycetota bacterium]